MCQRSIIKLNILKKQTSQLHQQRSDVFTAYLDVNIHTTCSICLCNKCLITQSLGSCLFYIIPMHSCSLAQCHIVSQCGKLSHYASMFSFLSVATSFHYILTLIAYLQLPNIYKLLRTNHMNFCACIYELRNTKLPLLLILFSKND